MSKYRDRRYIVSQKAQEIALRKNNRFDDSQLTLNAAEIIREDFHIILMTVLEIFASVVLHLMVMENLTVR